MNMFKTVFFLAILMLLFLGIGGLLGGQQGMTMAFGLALVINLGAYWFSDKLVLAMYRARPVTEAEAPELVRTVRRLAQMSNMPMPKVYVIPTQAANAFATGRSPHHAAVAATEGILQILDEEELEGVLAHELSHVHNRDVLIGTLTAAIAGAIYYLIDMARWGLMFGGGNRDDRERGGGALNVAALLVISLLAPLIAMLIQMAVSRSREYQADESGARLCRKPLALASALEKISAVASRRPMEQANPATAHLFIVNPLRGQAFMNPFSTHPPLDRRVEILRQLAHQL